MTALAISPQNSRLLYAGTRGSGIFRSTDGGDLWVELPSSPFRGPVHGLALDPERPARIFAALGGPIEVAGVYRSTNGGATWNRTIAGTFFELAFDPDDPDTVWAASVDGVFRTVNGGVDWQPVQAMVGLNPVPALSITLDPSDSSVVYVGSDGKVYRSEDSGVTWSLLPLPPSAGFVEALAVSPAETSLIYAGAEGGMFRSTDGGTSWSEIGPGIFAVRDLVLNPEDPDVLHLAGNLIVFDPPALPGVFRSTDGGDGWTLVDGLTGVSLSVALDPQDPDHVVAGTTDGFFRRVAGGNAWAPSNRGLFAHPIRELGVSPLASKPVFAVDDFGTAFRSNDGTEIWQPIFEGISLLGTHPRDASRVVALAESSAVLVSRNAGRTFEIEDFARRAGLRQSLELHDLAFDPTDADTLYVSSLLLTSAAFQVTVFEDVHRSTDGGKTWDSGWASPELAALDLAVDPFDRDIVYAATVQGLRVSHDGGATWDPPKPVPGLTGVQRVVPDPQQEGRLWLAGRSTVVRSDDRGMTALRVRAGLPIGRILDLTTDPIAGVVYVLVENAGVFRSSDGGATWASITGNLVADRLTGPLVVSTRGTPPPGFPTPRTLRVGTATGVQISGGPPVCTPGATTLCLLDGRFQVSVTWQDFQGGNGLGRTRALTDDTGAFWFFDADNLELMVKAIDGRTINGHFWIFYGALSNVGFDLTVTDTVTGVTKVFTNPPNRFASAGITDAFPDPGDSVLGPTPAVAASESSGSALRPAPNGLLPCGTTTNLCLQDQRFRVEVIWRDFQGGTGQGIAVPLTPDTGAFWFFDADNLELMVKVIDGRPVNGHFWVFLGSLSNVNFEVVVTDTASGRTWIRENPAGRFASIGDAGAFPAIPTSGGDP